MQRIKFLLIQTTNHKTNHKTCYIECNKWFIGLEIEKLEIAKSSYSIDRAIESYWHQN